MYLACRLNFGKRKLSGLVINEHVKSVSDVKWRVIETCIEGDAAKRTVAVTTIVQLVHELLAQHELPLIAEIAFHVIGEEAHLLRIPKIETPVISPPVPSPGHFLAILEASISLLNT